MADTTRAGAATSGNYPPTATATHLLPQVLTSLQASASLSAEDAVQLLAAIVAQEEADEQAESQRRVAALQVRRAHMQRVELQARRAAAEVRRMAAADIGAYGDGGGARLADEWRETLPAEEEVVGTLPESRYLGRPLRGHTSAALYLHGEWEAGCPPRDRQHWRYLVGEGADGLPSTEHASASSFSSSSSGVNPSVLEQAREVLKRPAFPDRGYPLLPPGSGSPGSRDAALAAAVLDDAAGQERAASASRTQLLRGIAELSGVTGAGMPP